MCSLIMRQQPEAVIKRLVTEAEQGSRIVISAITYSEMSYGQIGKKALAKDKSWLMSLRNGWSRVVFLTEILLPTQAYHVGYGQADRGKCDPVRNLTHDGQPAAEHGEENQKQRKVGV
ncbi:TPA: hypothetical protein ACYRLJ_000263 [Pseudomonas aeruginosa]